MTEVTQRGGLWTSTTLGHLTVAVCACLTFAIPDMQVGGAVIIVATLVFWALHRSRRELTGVAGIGILAACMGGIVAGATWPAFGAVLAGLMLALSLLALGVKETRYGIQAMFIVALIVVVLLIEEPRLVLFALAVGAFAAVTMAMLADEATASSRHSTVLGFLRTRAPRLAVATVPVLLLGLAAWLLLPVSEGPRRQLGPVQASGSDSRQAAPYLGHGPMDLSMRGNLPDTPVARVPLDSPPLWRLSALSRYDGHRWMPAMTSRGQTAERDEQHDDWLVRPQRGFDMVMAPGIVSHAEWTGSPENGNPRPYRVWAGPYSPVEGTGQGLPGVGPDDPTRPTWTQLPPSVTPRTKDLARQIVGDATHPQEAAQRIAVHLTSGEYRYDLNAGVAGQGRDSVDHFLFESKEGFCEHYASAEVVLLRSLGFPARVATGFRHGELTDEADRLIRATSAHAWVEVYVEGRGWVTVDPTPAAPEGGFNLTGLLTRHAETIGWVALVAAPLVVLAALLLRRRVARRRTAAADGAGPDGDEVVEAVTRLREALSERGARPGHTMNDLALRAPEVQSALAVADTLVYSRQNVSEKDRRAAVDSLDRYTSELVAARRGQGSGSA